MMKLFLVFLLMPIISFGAKVAVAKVGETKYVDTEVSTNIAFHVDCERFNRLEFALDFVPSTSNCLEVAIGNDADGDGVLSLDEMDFTFGYDIDEWFVRSAYEDSVKTLHNAMLDGVARSFVLRKDDIDPSWNLIRVIRRGNVYGEFISVKNYAVGLHLIVR